ncbi:hypothetical protein [Streptomyces montanisoli]|uniref:Uncharacterized protein n=1 Tax=Streptomyces montanisoli TaxID=2798581 RepID=A0A940MCP5_9ACTN|nr:hypothetical protein [Streptomyces montanisoli]MBP0460560.1 hypothetical protein [Streptomyces montanisoli]
MTGQAQDQSQQTQSQAQQPSWNPFATLEQVGLLALGAVDLALDQVRRAAGQGQGVASRSDLRELVADGVQDLKVRGELASKRVAASDSDNYLELMAHRAIARNGITGDAPAAGKTAPPHA